MNPTPRTFVLAAAAAAGLLLTHGISSAQLPPAEVESVSCISPTGEMQPIADWQEVQAEIAGLHLQFSKAMYDPPGDTEERDVENLQAYRLLAAGPTGALETESCDYEWGDEEVVEILDAIYDPATLSVRLEIDLGPVGDVEEGQYRLLVCDLSVDDEERLLLDGDQDGVPGGGVVISFRVERRSKFTNGYFDNGVDSWTPEIGVPEDWALDPNDADESWTSHSAALANLTGLPAAAVGQCVGVESWERLLFRSKVLTLGDPEQEGAVLHQCSFYEQPGCVGTEIGQELGLFNVEGAAEEWQQLENPVIVPTGALSAYCSLAVEPDEEAFEVLLDELELVPSPNFREDFEIGHLGRWTTFFPIPE